MKTLPRLLEILVSVRQLFSMEPVRQLFHVLQVIFRRIFIYIKDFIVNEFIPLIVDLNNFEVREEKIRYLTLSKQLFADLAAFFIIFALFAIFLYFSTQYAFENDHCAPAIDPQPENPPIVDLTEDENNPDSVFELPMLNHPRGDASTGPEKIILRKKHQILRKSRPYCIFTDNESSRSAISVKTTQSQHSQPVIIHPDIRSLNPDGFNSWIIRRTRSGQIYGKYPI
ncbi:hypothetical protein G9C98_003589 [Cotesia typhae]|uniref:Uncharacterized protein n=1 Tax=Cotesia typhae TaxID=2053667 RepID=A0A8J5QZ63_9HYME|nr:hypothetical protein G9C98_003589 [Cotesia typhae]